MENEQIKEEKVQKKSKFFNTLIGIVDFCLAVYLIYNIIAMLA